MTVWAHLPILRKKERKQLRWKIRFRKRRRSCGTVSYTHLSIAKDASKEDALAAGKAAIADKLTGNVIKEIYVPGKIINIVMK